MRSTFSILLFSALLTGCQLFGSEDSDSFTITPSEVSIADKQSGSVTFTILNTCASGCWINIGKKVEREGSTYDILVVAENSGQICPTVCLDLEQEITIEIPEPGNYSFRFIHRDSVHHELELSFP